MDSSGNLFIADTYNNVIREVNSSTGTITTVAGNGICGYSGDGGAATGAELNAPAGIAVDAAGDLFIADSGNDVVREVNHVTGVITTVAGNGTYGYSGDGGAATSAELGFPSAVAVDAAGNLFIADSGNNVIREVNSSTGMITTVAGNYDLGSGYSGDGQAATGAQLNYPTGVAVDAAGDLFIADSGNNVVREVNLSIAAPKIATVAGNYDLGSGYSGDGQAATNAQLSDPWGVAVDCHRQPLHRRQRQQRRPRGRSLYGRDHHRRGKRDVGLQRRWRRGHRRGAERPHGRRGGRRRRTSSSPTALTTPSARSVHPQA